MLNTFSLINFNKIYFILVAYSIGRESEMLAREAKDKKFV